MTSAAPFTHYRVETEDGPDGIYRVVGVAEKRVTLLKVGNVDGRRLNTGLVIELRHEQLDTLPEAPNPDGNRPVAETVARSVVSAVWVIRAFVQTVLEHPRPAILAGSALLLGMIGGNIWTAPELVFDLLVLVGTVGLAAVGSGRIPHR